MLFSSFYSMPVLNVASLPPSQVVLRVWPGTWAHICCYVLGGSHCPRGFERLLLGNHILQKILTSGGIKRGVCLACVNHQPASSKHAFSSSTFWWYSSCVLPVCPGALTIDRGQWVCILCNAQWTLCAVFLILSIHCNCFQRFFWIIPGFCLSSYEFGQSRCHGRCHLVLDNRSFCMP